MESRLSSCCLRQSKRTRPPRTELLRVRAAQRNLLPGVWEQFNTLAAPGGTTVAETVAARALALALQDVRATANGAFPVADESWLPLLNAALVRFDPTRAVGCVPSGKAYLNLRLNGTVRAAEARR